jgi:hypothetical protein
MTANVFVHAEHVDLGLLEDCLHLFVAPNLAFVTGVLKIIGLDVFPKALDDAWSRQLPQILVSNIRGRVGARYAR